MALANVVADVVVGRIRGGLRRRYVARIEPEPVVDEMRLLFVVEIIPVPARPRSAAGVDVGRDFALFARLRTWYREDLRS
jgi:hypothetical protein